MVNAVILASTPRDKEDLIDGKNKAFLEIYDRKVILYTLDGILESTKIEEVFVIGPEYIQPKKRLDDLLANYVKVKGDKKKVSLIKESENPVAWKRFLENVNNGGKYARGNNSKLLYVPTDIPLITGSSVDDFLENCITQDNSSENDFYYSIVSLDNVRKFRKKALVYEKLNRSGFKVTEGSYRVGNLALVNPDNLRNKELFAKCFVQSRKLAKPSSKAKLFFDLGLLDTSRIAYLYLTNKLGLQDVEKFASSKLSTRLRLIESRYAELEYDIDDRADLLDLRGYIRSTKSVVSKKVKA